MRRRDLKYTYREDLPHHPYTVKRVGEGGSHEYWNEKDKFARNRFNPDKIPPPIIQSELLLEKSRSSKNCKEFRLGRHVTSANLRVRSASLPAGGPGAVHAQASNLPRPEVDWAEHHQRNTCKRGYYRSKETNMTYEEAIEQLPALEAKIAEGDRKLEQLELQRCELEREHIDLTVDMFRIAQEAVARVHAVEMALAGPSVAKSNPQIRI